MKAMLRNLWLVLRGHPVHYAEAFDVALQGRYEYRCLVCGAVVR